MIILQRLFRNLNNYIYIHRNNYIGLSGTVWFPLWLQTGELFVGGAFLMLEESCFTLTFSTVQINGIAPPDHVALGVSSCSSCFQESNFFKLKHHGILAWEQALKRIQTNCPPACCLLPKDAILMMTMSYKVLPIVVVTFIGFQVCEVPRAPVAKKLWVEHTHTHTWMVQVSFACK